VKIAVFTKNRINPAYAAARMGAAKVARRFGAETLDFVPETPDDVDQQIRLIEEALEQGPDAFVLAPVHPTRVDGALRRIEKAGVPLCAFVNPVRAVKSVTFAGSARRWPLISTATSAATARCCFFPARRSPRPAVRAYARSRTPRAGSPASASPDP
jgi:ABC-type sugar transport system substrate-binding protein